MCGHVGIISKSSLGFFERDVKVFEDMLYIDTLRGDDATGMCAINKHSGATILKEASDASWFVYNNEYKAVRPDIVSKGRALLGHNRKATIGKRVDDNAHPFVLDDRYVFFHNGTLHNHKQLADTEVDSEALGMHLSKCEGDLDKLGDALNRVFGAYACVWYDADKDTVYFLRNNQRPLNFITTDDGTICYASEAWMAHGALMRNGYKVKEIKELKVDTLYSIDMSVNTPVIKEEAIPKKAPVPLQRHTGCTGTVLTKREAKGLAHDLKISTYISFFPDEAICSSPHTPSANECYDWLIVASNPEYEGVEFKYILKDKFQYEVDDLTNGRFCTAMYSKHEYRDGVLEVWVSNVNVPAKSKTCH
jgi:hypothetical protein